MITLESHRATYADIPEINRVLNDDSVRGTAGFPSGVNELDVAGTFDRFVYFVFPGGFVLFDPSKQHEGVFEGHIAALRGYRGENALEGAQSAVNWLFESGQAETIIVDFPSHRRDIRALVKWIGFTRRGESDSWTLTYEDWKERR